MIRRVRLRREGGSLVLTLPVDVVRRLHLEAGDVVALVDTGDGVLLDAADDTVHRAVEAYDRLSRRYRNAFRVIADDGATDGGRKRRLDR